MVGLADLVYCPCGIYVLERSLIRISFWTILTPSISISSEYSVEISMSLCSGDDESEIPTRLVRNIA